MGIMYSGSNRVFIFFAIYIAILFGVSFLPQEIVNDRLDRILITYSIVLIAFISFFIKQKFKHSINLSIKIHKPKYIIPILIVILTYSIYSSNNFGGNGKLLYPIYLILITAFIQTLCEELIFRGLLINTIESTLKLSTKKAVVISAIIFGLFHLFSFNKTTDVDAVLNQLIISIGVGYFLGALFVLSKNILVPTLAHFLINLPAYFKRIAVEQPYKEQGLEVIQDISVLEIITSSFLVILIYSPFFIVGYFLLKKAKH